MKYSPLKQITFINASTQIKSKNSKQAALAKSTSILRNRIWDVSIGLYIAIGFSDYSENH